VPPHAGKLDPQGGLDHHRDVEARLLRIEGEDPAGQSHTLYDDAPYPELGAAIVRDGRYPNIAITLPHNETVTLWIRQTAPSRTSWSIHELRLWRYDSSGGIR
jgi:hypothetical protein